MNPLTKDRQDMAAKWLPYACKLARKYAAAYGGDVAEWESVAAEAACIAASKFNFNHPTAFMGIGNFPSAVWYRVRSHLNDYKRRLDLCGMTRAPRNRMIERKEALDVVDRRSEMGIEEHEQITTALERLDDREFAVIQGRFGRGENLEKVGRRIGVCKERARQIESVALGKMRRALSGGEYAGSN